MTQAKISVLSLVLATAVAASLLTFFLRNEILSGIGSFLLAATPRASTPEADLLIVIRGDETRFERALTAAKLFQDGRAVRIYVSSALNDEDLATLSRIGISLPTPQQNIATILTAQGVPCERISLDRSTPGGGTVGEARRVANFMVRHNLHSAIAVTSWYHTRRTKAIFADALKSAGMSISVAAADSEIGPRNWWKYRYVSIIVLEELFKYLVQLCVRPIGFIDDPGSNGANEGKQEVSACNF